MEKQTQIDYTDRSNYRYLLKDGKIKIQCKSLKPYTGTQKQRALAGEIVKRRTYWKDFSNNKNGLKKSYSTEKEAKEALQQFIGHLKSY